MGAFKFGLDGGRVVSARIAFGGMAATPRRAGRAEAALQGVSLPISFLVARTDRDRYRFFSDR